MPKHKIRILWEIVDSIPDSLGHGIEIHYSDGQEFSDNFIVAFVEGFAWLRIQSDNAIIKIINPESVIFEQKKLDGIKVRSEIEKALSPYILDRKLPTTKDYFISEHISAWVNG